MLQWSVGKVGWIIPVAVQSVGIIQVPWKKVGGWIVRTEMESKNKVSPSRILCKETDFVSFSQNLLVVPSWTIASDTKLNGSLPSLSLKTDPWKCLHGTRPASSRGSLLVVPVIAKSKPRKKPCRCSSHCPSFDKMWRNTLHHSCLPSVTFVVNINDVLLFIELLVFDTSRVSGL